MATQDALLVVHGGGPTAVINASLFGAVDEALKTPGVGRVLGALGGMGGITDGTFVDFAQVSPEKLSLLPRRPRRPSARAGSRSRPTTIASWHTPSSAPAFAGFCPRGATAP